MKIISNSTRINKHHHEIYWLKIKVISKIWKRNFYEISENTVTVTHGSLEKVKYTIMKGKLYDHERKSIQSWEVYNLAKVYDYGCK